MAIPTCVRHKKRMSFTILLSVSVMTFLIYIQVPDKVKRQDPNVIKRSFGSPCNTTNTCQQPLLCSSQNTCICNRSTHYLNTPTQQCSTKIRYGSSCRSAQSSDNVCAETDNTCISDPSGSQRCLCDTDHYRSNNDLCKSLNNLRVTSPSNANRKTRRIGLTWNSGNPERNDVIYTVNYGNNQNVGGNRNGATVSGLRPGTYYNFKIISSLPLETYYPEKSALPVSYNTSTAFSYSQECDKTQATNVVCDGANTRCITALDNSKRCLCNQNYYRTSSGLCVSLYYLKVTSPIITTRETTRIVFNWNSGSPDRNDVTYAIKYDEEVPANQTGGTVSGLTPGTQYNFQIISSLPADTLYPEKPAGPVRLAGIWTRPSLTRILSTYGVGGVLFKPANSESSETEIKVNVCVACLLDNSQGTVSDVGIVVCVKGGQNPCDTSDREKWSANEYEKMPTWNDTMTTGFGRAYRTTPKTWIDALQKAETSTSYPYIVGSDETCSEMLPGIKYCNGPLPVERDLVLSAFACSPGGCAELALEFSRSASSNDFGLALGLGLGLGLSVLAAAAIVAVVIYRKKKLRNENQNQYQNSNDSFDHVSPGQNDPHRYEEATGASTGCSPKPHQANISHTYDEANDYEPVIHQDKNRSLATPKTHNYANLKPPVAKKPVRHYANVKIFK